MVAPSGGRGDTRQGGRGQQQRRQRLLGVRLQQSLIDQPDGEDSCKEGRTHGSAPQHHTGFFGVFSHASSLGDLQKDLLRHAPRGHSRSFSSCTAELVAFTQSWTSFQVRNSAPASLNWPFSCSKSSKYLQEGHGVMA